MFATFIELFATFIEFHTCSSDLLIINIPMIL